MTNNSEKLTTYLKDVAHRGRTMLLPALHFAQDQHGWLPEAVQREISEALRVPLAEIHGVIEFYTMFYNEPTSKKVIRICDGSACELNNASAVMQAAETELALKHGESSDDLSVTYERVPCLGMCESAPVGLNDDLAAGSLTPNNVPNFLAGELAPPIPQIFGDHLALLARVGKSDPSSLKSYEEHGGYEGLRKCLEMSADEVIEIVESLGILGRGGAQFPTGTKWSMTRAAEETANQKHIVINADESEPGTFKDRVIMEEDPFSVIEAATLAGYAVGAENGWIFVRGEYPKSYQLLEQTIKLAREKGYLGKNILGKEGFNFDIEIRKGAGAYICGEETALFEAIEGKRGFPRIKPPFPTTHGLFNQPTVINNVETMAAVLAAINMGQDAWEALGTPESPGTKLFCLSGNVKQAGLYEVPFGLSIGEMIGMAGGVADNKQIQGVLLGGAAGVFVGPEKLHVKLSYEDARASGLPIGSGVIMVFDEDANIMNALTNLAHFFAHESCGKCFPCQLGTQRQLEIVANGAQRSHYSKAQQIDLADIGFAMSETSICGLGQTASSAIQSAIHLWPELVE